MKFNDDAWFSNTYNATVCGVDKEELLSLEINFLKLIDYKLMVDPQTFKNYYNHIVEMAGSKSVLSNCSCLDPSHSYKQYSKMAKGKEGKKTTQTKCELKTKGSDSSILTTDKTDSNRSQNSSKSIDFTSQVNSVGSESHSNSQLSMANNKIMEEELEIASSLVNQGKNISFNPN